MNNDYLRTIFSHFFHYIFFLSKKPPSDFDSPSLTISIDVDVGSSEVGLKNGGLNDRNVNDFLTEYDVGKIEEQVIPLLLKTFNEFQFPVTFALRGQLTEVETPIIDKILNSSPSHEIAAHGYYHRAFTSLSEFEADEELEMISTGLKKFGVTPKSFIFPRNRISHLQVLKKHGYVSFRAPGTLRRDGLYVRDCDGLLDVHPSLFSDFRSPFFLKKIVNLAVNYKAPLHIWFHPWNLGSSPELAAKRISEGLVPFLNYVLEKKKHGGLTFETMSSITEKYRRLGKNLSGSKANLFSGSSRPIRDIS
jgi:peptidoglycan/xylan/chitin deacetylase (PgdA/CDA1 family)